MGRTHLERHRRNPRANVEWLFDLDPTRAAALAAEFGLKTAPGFEQILSSRVDVVDICLPTHLHSVYSVRAAMAGKHVLCEKPFALSLEEADRTIDATRRAKVLCMVGHVVRFWSEYVQVKRWMLEGALGEPLSLSARRCQPAPAWSAGGWIGNEKCVIRRADPAEVSLEDARFALEMALASKASIEGRRDVCFTN